MNAGPAPTSTRSAAAAWLKAARPATLPAAVSGVVVGLGAACADGAPFRADTAAECLAVAILLQVLANIANDLSDFRRGADTPDRLGPVRVAASGLISTRALETAIGVLVAAIGLDGVLLTLAGGPAVLMAGVAAVVSAVAYTGGPWPYGYRGLGEPLVFVFFGLVGVAGTAFLQSGRLTTLDVIAAVPIGTIVTAILVVNNLRDRETDVAAGKRTLAVIFGSAFARREYATCLAVAWLVPLLLLAAGAVASTGGAPASGAWRAGPLVLLPLLALPLAPPLWRTVASPGDPRRLNPVLRDTARLSLVFAILFAVGLAAGGRPLQPT